MYNQRSQFNFRRPYLYDDVSVDSEAKPISKKLNQYLVLKLYNITPITSTLHSIFRYLLKQSSGDSSHLRFNHVYPHLSVRHSAATFISIGVPCQRNVEPEPCSAIYVVIYLMCRYPKSQENSHDSKSSRRDARPLGLIPGRTRPNALVFKCPRLPSPCQLTVGICPSKERGSSIT